MAVRPQIRNTALEGLLPGDALGVRRPGVQRFLEPGFLGFLLGFALCLFTAGLDRADGLDRPGLLGEPDLAEIAFADIREDLRDLVLVQGFAFQQLQRQLVQDVAVLGQDGVGLVVGAPSIRRRTSSSTT